MRKSFLWMLVGLFIAASGSLIGCGDNNDGGGGGGKIVGAGGGGASTFAQGIITNATGTGVTVNGIDIDTSSANIMLNGNTVSIGDLKPGQFVSVRGFAAGTSGSATSVEATSQMLGPVTEKTGAVSSNPISSATATVTIFGQSVVIDGNTQFEPADQGLNSISNGAKLEVSGMSDSAGNLLATLITSRPTTTFYSVQGLVSDMSGSTFTLRPNGGNGKPLTVTLGQGATISTSGLGTGTAGTSGGTGGTGSNIGTGGTGTTGGMGSNLGTGGTGTTGGMGSNLGTGGTGTTGGTGSNIGSGGTGTAGTGGTAGQIQMMACPASGTTDVTIQDFSFNPATLTISANTIVKWTNNGPSLHTVTSTTNGQFDSGNINAGSSVCFSFPTAGTFNYFCSLHPFMTGSVTVTGSDINTGGTGTAGGTGGTGTTAGTGGATGTGAGGTGAATLQDGQTVTVKIDPATYQAGSTSITATSVAIENMLLPVDNDVVFLEGFPTDISGSTLKVGGIPVNAGTQTVPAEGQRIAVHGIFSNGTVAADMIQPAAAANLTMGAISSISTVSGAGGTGAGGTSTAGTGTDGTGIGTGTTGTTGAGGTGTGGTGIGTGTTGTTGAGGTSTDGTGIGTGTTGTTASGGTGTTGTGAGGTGTGTAGTGATGGAGTTGAGTGGTGSATMIVNGTTFDISSAQIKMNGQPASIADLLPGKQVIVKSAATNFASIFSQATGTTGTGAGGIGTGGTGTTGTGAGGIGTGGTGTTGTGAGGIDTGGTGTTGTGTGGTTAAPGSGGSYLTGHAKTDTSGDTGTGGTGGTDGTGTGGTDTSGIGTGGTGTTGIGTGGTGTTGGTGGTGTTGGTGNIGTGGTGTTGTGTGGTGGVVKAISVWIIDNIQGPASDVSGSISSGTTGTSTGSNATFTVFGQTIIVDSTTKFGTELSNLLSSGTGTGLSTGVVIEASGIPNNTGDLLATFIESRATTTEYHVRGLVSGVTGSPVSTFRLTPVPGGSDLTVSLASNVTATIANGMTVNVKIDPATFTGGGSTSVTAKAVEPVQEPVPAETDLVNLEGIVADLTGSTFTVNGFEVDAGDIASMTGVSNGKKVRVQGTVSGGTIKATQVQTL